MTSIDEGENPELIGQQKRKHDPLITSLSNTKVTRRFFRTYAGCNGPEQIEESHQETPPTTPDIDIQVVRVADLVINPVKGRIEPGTSSSAQASQKIRNEANNGTYVAGGKKLENWRRKICKLDPDVKFNKENSRKVFHTRCAWWLLVKEPGDTTRFKEHLQACRVKLVPVEGTLFGMGWSRERRTEDKMNNKLSMPCRGATALDNLLIDQYLKRTGAIGGSARSIHTISKERFSADVKYLTRDQKDEVYAAQRVEWAWRNDHLNLRVHATNCEGFTSSHSFATSLCPSANHYLVSRLSWSQFTRRSPWMKMQST